MEWLEQGWNDSPTWVLKAEKTMHRMMRQSGDFYRPPLRDTAENWNQFRGPERNGHIPLQSVSIDWTNPQKPDGPPRADWGSFLHHNLW